MSSSGAMMPPGQANFEAVPSTGAVVTARQLGPDYVHETTASNTAQGQIDNLFGRPDVHTETRKVSSVIIEQRYLGEMPQQDEVRYVEVPTVEEEVRYVTKKETREKLVEVRVPVIEYVDRVVEVPRIEYTDRVVEIPQVQEVYIDEKVVQYVDRMVDVIKEVPVVKYRETEKIVEVPGPVVEVPKPYIVEVPRDVYQAVETEVPVIVAQTIKPVIIETNKQMLVDVMDYEPEVVPVDVHVAKPVASALELIGQTESRHRLVNISSAQYNSILRQLNVHMDEKIKHTLPYVTERGQVQFVDERNLTYIVAPDHLNIEGYNRRGPTTRPINVHGVVAVSGRTVGGITEGNQITTQHNYHGGHNSVLSGTAQTVTQTTTQTTISRPTSTAQQTSSTLKPPMARDYHGSITTIPSASANFQTTVGATPYRLGVTTA